MGHGGHSHWICLVQRADITRKTSFPKLSKASKSFPMEMFPITSWGGCLLQLGWCRESLVNHGCKDDEGPSPEWAADSESEKRYVQGTSVSGEQMASTLTDARTCFTLHTPTYPASCLPFEFPSCLI